MAAQERVTVDREKIRSFCTAHGIRRLSLFGSILTDQFGPKSDVDVLVEFLVDSIPGFFSLADMEAELSNLFNGRKVDFRTPQDISRHIRQQVSGGAEVLYELG